MLVKRATYDNCEAGDVIFQASRLDVVWYVIKVGQFSLFPRILISSHLSGRNATSVSKSAFNTAGYYKERTE